MYGSYCELILSIGNGVNGFTLDPSIGEFIMTHPKVSNDDK
jgi:fructose-1,6-bisphosphatase I